MSSYIQLDDLEAMAQSCYDAFITPEQAAILIELWRLREKPNNSAFEREYAPEGDEV